MKIIIFRGDLIDIWLKRMHWSRYAGIYYNLDNFATPNHSKLSRRTCNHQKILHNSVWLAGADTVGSPCCNGYVLLCHPENCIFTLSKKCAYGIKVSQNMLYYFKHHCSKVLDLQGLIQWAPLVATAMDLVWPLLRKVTRVCARRVDMSAQLVVLKSHAVQVRRRAVQCLCFQNQRKHYSDIFLQKGVFQI